MSEAPQLPKDQFLDIVAKTPLVSIDLVVRSPGTDVLMGWRTNEPARDHWFVPGGRIRKGETIEAAFARLCSEELDMDVPLSSATLKGAYTHLYENNFANAEGVSTHYVVIAYELRAQPELDALPRGQHTRYTWVTPGGSLEDVHPNSAAYL